MIEIEGEYQPMPEEELLAIQRDDGRGLPKEAIVASQQYLAMKLLEAQRYLKNAIEAR